MLNLKRYGITVGIILLLGITSVSSSTDSFNITITVGEFCSSTIPSTATQALPRSVFLITATLTATSALDDVNATLNCDDNWVFLSGYPQTINIGHMEEGETYNAQWFSSTPITEGTYNISVTVEATGGIDYTTDEAQIEVTYDIYGFETNSKDISDDLYVYKDKTYTTPITSVCHNDIIYLHATGGLTDNSYMYGYFHLVYDGAEHDTVIATIEKSCAIINGELNVELDLSKVDGGKLRENGTYYILMSAKDNLTVDSTRVYGESQTFTYQVCEGGGDKTETATPLPSSVLYPLQRLHRQVFTYLQSYYLEL